jgi:endo-alpha-N-acetylgalactosaminidase
VRAASVPTRFEADVGIDDSTGGRGSVQFRVLVDGKEKFTSPIVRGGDSPLPVSVDVTGAEKLELVVDYADRGDVLDHADWLNARLVQ